MKLNPPETAPKDGTEILATFYKSKQLQPTVWNIKDAVWLMAFAYEGSFLIFSAQMKAMTGWLPMPTIDDQGNVI